MKKMLTILGVLVLCAVVAFLVVVKSHFRKARIEATALGTEALQNAEARLLERAAALEKDYPDWQTKDSASSEQFRMSLEMLELEVSLYQTLLESCNSVTDQPHAPPANVQAVIKRVEARKR